MCICMCVHCVQMAGGSLVRRRSRHVEGSVMAAAAELLSEIAHCCMRLNLIGVCVFGYIFVSIICGCMCVYMYICVCFVGWLI